MADVNGGDREGAHHELFSMVASDNAEVIPPEAPRGPESMWSVAANAGADEGQDGVADADPGDERSATWSTSNGSSGAGAPPPFGGWDDGGRAAEDDASQAGPVRRGGPDSVGSVFSAEPVDHLDDVLDEAEVVDESAWTVDGTAEGSLFSNGSHLRDEVPRRPTNGHGGPGAGSTSWSDDPWVDRDGGWEAAGGEWDPRSAEWWDRPQSAAPDGRSGPDLHAPDPLVIDDPQGYDTAILRLHPHDRERAHVPLSVCGALLHEDEHVKGVVTGQMLGRPAAVVVTEDRVLVVNDRRWQPVVDIFPIDGDLVVRGRHDRQIAALSFADATRVSMVDGIGEVEIAIELAEHIRDAGPRGGS